MISEPTVSDVAKEWIAHWRSELESGKFPDGDGSVIVHDLIREEPDIGWAVILAILENIDAEPSSRLFQVLAAGPLEDLLARHGTAMIQRVEREAETNPRFKLLLGGVWQNTMRDDVWSRVQTCRSETW